LWHSRAQEFNFGQQFLFHPIALVILREAVNAAEGSR
jgi:hypothetical protein